MRARGVSLSFQAKCSSHIALLRRFSVDELESIIAYAMDFRKVFYYCYLSFSK